MKEKGFTLIELIAVIVIMGMLLLIVFPATSRLLKSNEEKKFDMYYDSTKEAIERYARTRRDELGGIEGEGCVDDKTLSELKEYDYISEYKEEKNVSCLSPGDFTTEMLTSLGIDTSKQYVNIRIDNNKGNISVKYSMVCVRNYDDPETISLLYSRLEEKNSTCEMYVPVITGALIKEIDGKYTTVVSDTTNYVTSNPNNNYVSYSGRLWRIISYDTNAKTIKLVSEDNVGLVKYNYNESYDYNTSNIYGWLRSKFLPSLNNPEKYLDDAKWYYLPTTINVHPTGGSFVTSKVGLISYYEYSKASNYLNNGYNFWTITEINVNNNKRMIYIDSSGTQQFGESLTYYGVRPSIVLKENVKYIYGGDGTQNNPYKLLGDTSANIGASLNSRYPGEYVTINNILFRISSVEPGYTKLITTEPISIDQTIIQEIPNIQSSQYNPVANTIAYGRYSAIGYEDNTFVNTYLNIWIAPFDDLLTEGEFYEERILPSATQLRKFNAKVAIPRLEDLYAANENAEYWTISGGISTGQYVISVDSTTRDISQTTLASVVPIIVVKNSVIITGGNGTQSNPYTIG